MPRLIAFVCLIAAGAGLALQYLGAPLAAQPANDPALPTSRYSTIDNCTEIGNGMPDRDWVAYKCEGFGGIPIWLRYADSARAYLGFGASENYSGPFALDRDDTWRVEWRGVEYDGRFTPFAAVLRMKRPDAGQQHSDAGLLFVYALRADGTSCLVATDLTSNEVARARADMSKGETSCLFDPH